MTIATQSCIDKNYDLSNVDTNIMVPVENLTIPVSVDPVQLHSILDLEENSQIKERNGKYAVVVEGEFETENIMVNKFQINGAVIDEIKSKSKKNTAENAKAQTRTSTSDNIGNLLALYTLPNEKSQLTVSAKEISNALKTLTDLKLDTKITTTISLDKSAALKDILDSIRVDKFSFKLPRGFEGELKAVAKGGKEVKADEFDSKTGLASFNTESLVSEEGEINLEFTVTGINKEVLDEVMEQIEKNSNFTYSDDIGVEEGCISVYENDFKKGYDTMSDVDKYNSLPDELDFNSEQSMEDAEVKEFSGKIDYDVKDFNIEPINLEGIPDMLNQSGTFLNLDNPQIYLSINNTIEDGSKKVIPALTGFEITAVGKNGVEKKYALDEGEQIVAKNKENTFYMSPKEISNEDKYSSENDSYQDAEHVVFSSLGQILSGGDSEHSLGIPEKLVVKAVNTKLESDNVESFDLGKEFEAITGKYVFYAPLALTPGSRIRYTDTIDGWSSDELDKVTINHLVVRFDVSTDIPFSLLLKVTPIDKNGKKIDVSTSAKVEANAKNQAMVLELDGEIQQLDGIVLDATASVQSTETLRPDMKITIGQIKATVTGSYQTEL